EELDANAQRFADQAFRILERDRTEVRFNGEWLAKLSFAEVVRLTRVLTVARLLERDDFAKRFAAQESISLSELLYPPMQAYDSVAIDADVEIGGTDQLYNLLTGRDVMERYGKDPQLVVTYPLLVGIDGAEKMSKSRGNYVGILEPPEEMFGKTMSIPDEALPQWWELLGGGGEHPESPAAPTRWTRAPSTAPSSRPASASSPASVPFDSPGPGATISRLPKLAALESPCKRPQRSASKSNRNPFVPRFRGLGRESGP